jgi:hypothetical protein
MKQTTRLHLSPAMRALKESAAESATWRGHSLIWEYFSNENALGTCRTCGAEVQCLLHPAPNQIDIGGEAVALNCPAK